jgi:hypothetical protein
MEGLRCKTCDYSDKSLITIASEEKMIKEEMKRVRSFKDRRAVVRKACKITKETV